MTAVRLPRSVCEVRDRRFVDPCTAVAQEPFELVHVVDPRTLAPSQAFVGTWSGGSLRPLRMCPYCGVEMPGQEVRT